MTGTPTTNWGFPTYDGTEPGSLKTVSNAQANAAETAMNNASKGFYLRYTTKALMLANVTASANQHATVYADSTTANNGDYWWQGGAWARVLTGLNMVTPTSVVGGTATANGAVTFTTATAVSLNGLLTSAFDVYEVIVSLTATSAADNLAFRLRTAGADYSGGGHNTTVKEVAAGAAQTIAYTPNNTLAPIARSNGVDGTDVTFRIYSPAIAANLKRYGVCHPTYDGSATERVASGYINSRVAYDGITLLCSAGASMTGKARVYGIYNG